MGSRTMKYIEAIAAAQAAGRKMANFLARHDVNVGVLAAARIGSEIVDTVNQITSRSFVQCYFWPLTARIDVPGTAHGGEKHGRHSNYVEVQQTS